jgi:hypothetical protein
MKPEGLGWIQLAMDTIEVAAFLGLFWQFFDLRREIRSILRVIRRIDRRMAVGVSDQGTIPGL